MNAKAEAISLDQPIAVYEEFRAQLAELVEENKKAVFDYEDPEGNKEARSHIYKLRQTKSAVDKARKKEKQASLEYGRRVDSEAKEIIGQIEDMIEVHATPIREIEEREAKRVAALEDRLDALKDPMTINPTLPSPAFQEWIDKIEAVEIDESWDEYRDGAARQKEATLDWLRTHHSDALKREEQAAELEQLRREKEERDRRDREEQIKREAAERAKREAEEKAQREKEEAERKVAEREAKLKAEAEKAEREKEDAERRAQEAEEKARQELEEKQQREREEAERREANKRHRTKVLKQAKAALAENGVDSEQAALAIDIIAAGKVPSVSIAY